MEKVVAKQSDVIYGRSVLLDGTEIQDGQYAEDPFCPFNPKNLLVKIKGYRLMVIPAADFDEAGKDFKDAVKEKTEERKLKKK